MVKVNSVQNKISIPFNDWLSLAVFCSDFYSSQQFQSWKWTPSDDVGDRGKDNSVAFSNCLPGFVSRQRLILIDIKDKEVSIVSRYSNNHITSGEASPIFYSCYVNFNC